MKKIVPFFSATIIAISIIAFGVQNSLNISFTISSEVLCKLVWCVFAISGLSLFHKHNKNICNLNMVLYVATNIYQICTRINIYSLRSVFKLHNIIIFAILLACVGAILFLIVKNKKIPFWIFSSASILIVAGTILQVGFAYTKNPNLPLVIWLYNLPDLFFTSILMMCCCTDIKKGISKNTLITMIVGFLLFVLPVAVLGIKPTWFFYNTGGITQYNVWFDLMNMVLLISFAMTRLRVNWLTCSVNIILLCLSSWFMSREYSVIVVILELLSVVVLNTTAIYTRKHIKLRYVLCILCSTICFSFFAHKLFANLTTLNELLYPSIYSGSYQKKICILTSYYGHTIVHILIILINILNLLKHRNKIVKQTKEQLV